MLKPERGAPRTHSHSLGERLCRCFIPARPDEVQMVRRPSAGDLLRRLASSRSFGLLPPTPPPIGERASFERTPEEEVQMSELCTRLTQFLARHSLPSPRGVLTEQRLLRYVRFIDDPGPECERMILLRQALGMDAIYDTVASGGEFPAEVQMSRIWQHNLFGEELTDRAGRPVFVATIGGLSCTRPLFARVPPELVRSYLHHCLERLNQRISAVSEQQVELASWTYVLDLTGFSLWQAAGSEWARSFFKALGEEVNRLAVPYQIARVLLVHAPPQWQLVWKAAMLILPPKVQRKVHMCHDLASLAVFIAPSQLPARYAGVRADALTFVERSFGREVREPPLGLGLITQSSDGRT